MFHGSVGLTTMKALSMKDPWATLLLQGKKTIETRKWTTKYRGEILFCATKWPHSAIAGLAFATAELIECRPMTKDDEAAACCPVYERAYSWILKDIRPLEVKFKVKGQLGLFDVEVPL
jgi:hypothetical protein